MPEKSKEEQGRIARLKQLEDIRKEVDSWPSWVHNVEIPYHEAFNKQYEKEHPHSQTSP